LRTGGYANLAPHLGAGDNAITVQNDRVVRVCAKDIWLSHQNLKDYQQYTVEGLFDWASTTLLNPFIHASYDPVLGYPISISGGFLEYGGTQIVNFRVLSARDFNVLPSPDLTCVS